MIDRADAYNIVILVQSRLDGPASRALRRQFAQLLASGQERILVFFHAAAAALDDADERSAWANLSVPDRTRLEFCQAARGRRVAGEPAGPFKASSLVRFWDAVLRADSLYAPDRCSLRPGGFLILLRQTVAEPEAREYLEMVLAGASLDLDLVVLFEDEGLALLAGDRARPWAQLVDYGLARMATSSAEPIPQLLERVDAAQVEQWRAARTLIEP